MESKSAWRVAIALAILHFVFATLYSLNTPFLTAGRVFSQGGGPEGVQTIDIGAPDELQHVIYAARLANGEGMPVLKVGDPNLDLYYQAHQPPLFYVLTAAWMKMAAPDVPKVAELTRTKGQNEVIEIIKSQKRWGEVSEGLTYEKLQSEGKMLRILNSIIGAATVLGLFYFGAIGLRNVWAGIGAAIFGALLPMNVALSGAISNDPLLICLCTWSLALLAGATATELTFKRALLIGLLTGGALLTKTSALMLVPLWFVAWFFARAQMPMAKVAAGFALALVIGGAWFMRNQSVYGEPFVMKTFNEAFKGRSPVASDFIARVGPAKYWIEGVAEPSAKSFVGTFSYWDIWLPDGLYRVVLLIFVILGLASLMAFKRADANRPALWLAWATIVVTKVLFVQFNLGFYQAQGRYLVPGILGFAGVVGLGMAMLTTSPKAEEEESLRDKRPVYALGAFAMLMILVNVYVLMVLPGGFEARILPSPGG